MTTTANMQHLAECFFSSTHNALSCCLKTLVFNQAHQKTNKNSTFLNLSF